MNRFISNFISLTASLTIAVGILEVGSRLYVKLTDLELYPIIETWGQEGIAQDFGQIFDTEMGWKLEPGFDRNHIQVNSLGIRSSEEFDPESPKKRVLLLGDSMVNGFKVKQEHIFSEILNQSHSDITFINTGVNSYSLWQKYLALKKYAALVQPDLVILFVTQSNDWLEITGRDHFRPPLNIKNGTVQSQSVSKSTRIPIYKKLVAYRVLNRKFLHGRDMSYLIDRLDLMFRKDKSRPLRLSELIFNQFSEMRDEMNFPMIVVDIPTQNQLKDVSMDRSRQQWLKRIAEERGFGYLNLTDHYPENYASLFLPGDTHWSAEGHQLVAGLMKQLVARQELSLTR